MQIEDEAFIRQCMLEEILRAQTTPQKHLRDVHLGLANIYEQQLLALQQESSSTRR